MHFVLCCDASLSTLVADRLWKEWQKCEQDFQGNVSASASTFKKWPNTYVWLLLPFFFSYFYLTVALPSIQVTITCTCILPFTSINLKVDSSLTSVHLLD